MQGHAVCSSKASPKGRAGARSGLGKGKADIGVRASGHGGAGAGDIVVVDIGVTWLLCCEAHKDQQHQDMLSLQSSLFLLSDKDAEAVTVEAFVVHRGLYCRSAWYNSKPPTLCDACQAA